MPDHTLEGRSPDACYPWDGEDCPYPPAYVVHAFDTSTQTCADVPVCPIHALDSLDNNAGEALAPHQGAYLARG